MLAICWHTHQTNYQAFHFEGYTNWNHRKIRHNLICTYIGARNLKVWFFYARIHRNWQDFYGNYYGNSRNFLGIVIGILPIPMYPCIEISYLFSLRFLPLIYIRILHYFLLWINPWFCYQYVNCDNFIQFLYVHI